MVAVPGAGATVRLALIQDKDGREARAAAPRWWDALEGALVDASGL